MTSPAAGTPDDARHVSGKPCGVDVMKAIYERRAVRNYTARQVDEDLVRELIGAALQAPSAVNQQPWSFVVIQHRGMLQRLCERSKGLALTMMTRGTPMWEHREALADPDFDIFHGAGTLIVICAAPGLGSPNEDCCLAAQNLMLAAHGLGLATCPIGLAREALGEPQAKTELGIPADHSVVIPVLVGYPREVPAASGRRDALIHSWH